MTGRIRYIVKDSLFYSAADSIEGSNRKGAILENFNSIDLPQLFFLSVKTSYVVCFLLDLHRSRHLED